MTQRRKLIDKCRNNPAGIRFRELCLPANWISAARKAGRTVPEPIVEKKFKGRFPLRIPEDLRRYLELEAKRKGISLNQLILRRIA